MPDDTKTIRPRAAPEKTIGWEATCTTLLDGHQQGLKIWLQTMQCISEELSALAAMRLQLAMEGCSTLAACRNPEELIDWSKRMTSKMTAHCAGEIDKLSQMTVRVTLMRPADPGTR